ncbi:uncharacterized protein LOC108511900 [Phoenix dactylifera]|uniref:Uncharacterized protein LOC108511900 n=1 Tax=Phoenix dactylifera TaxID=42345 RepID=A0A8B9A813_PHODC|nr:uncharacterized protein LOC108511900 [Phoenix dactylifera]
MAEGLMTIRFGTGEEQATVLATGPWVVADQLLAMEEWQADFTPGTQTVSRTMVWVRLPGLPLEYWDRAAIFEIVAAAGRPVELDGVSNEWRRIGYARVRVEVDAVTRI